MVKQVTRSASAHRIQYQIDTLSTREFSRGNEICIASDQDNLVDLPFERHRRNVQAEPHIDTFLHRLDLEVGIRRGKAVIEPSPQCFWFWNPGHVLV